MLFRVKRHFDFIPVNVETTTLHKYVLQRGKIILELFLGEINVVYSVLIPS